MTYHLTPSRMASIWEAKNTSVCQDVEKRGTFVYVGGNVNCLSRYGKEYEGVF